MDIFILEFKRKRTLIFYFIKNEERNLILSFLKQIYVQKQSP